MVQLQLTTTDLDPLPDHQCHACRGLASNGLEAYAGIHFNYYDCLLVHSNKNERTDKMMCHFLCWAIILVAILKTQQGKLLIHSTC